MAALVHVLAAAAAVVVDGASNKYAADELLCSVYPKKTSNDVDLDPCKAGKCIIHNNNNSNNNDVLSDRKKEGENEGLRRR